MRLPPPAAGNTPQRLKELGPAQVAAIIADDPRLIVPVGTCEQHGAHLPLGCATIIAERLADDLSAASGVIVAPTLEYGVNAAAECVFPGNASMRKKTLHRMLNDLLDTWEASGFREFILLTAHDYDAHQEALDTVITHTARVRVVDIYAVDIADLLTGQSGHLHGGEADTSLMLYLAPELVHMELARDFTLSPNAARRYRRGNLRVPKDSAGSVGHPTLATVEKGNAIYERIRDRIRERIFLAAASNA
ncbi:MAG TPA: creatininase family protein [Gemmatimonadaceae bacterium]